MTSGRTRVHFSRSSLSIVVSEGHGFLHFLDRVHHKPLEIFDIESLAVVLSYIKTLGIFTASFLSQQVKNVFFVDFQITAAYQILGLVFLGPCVFVDDAEYMRETIRNYAAFRRSRRITHHSVRLATPCLAICKNGTIVALEHRLDQGECGFIVNVLLQ